MCAVIWSAGATRLSQSPFVQGTQDKKGVRAQEQDARQSISSLGNVELCYACLKLGVGVKVHISVLTTCS